MIDTLNECLAYARYLESEHQKIRCMVRDIQEIFRGTACGDDNGSVPMISILMERLSALRDQLQRHFAEEEQGGCMEEAVCRRPSLARVVDELELQHGHLLGDLRHVIGLFRQDKTTTDDLTEFVQQFNEFAKSLGQHESAESRLLQQGLNLSSDDMP